MRQVVGLPAAAHHSSITANGAVAAAGRGGSGGNKTFLVVLVLAGAPARRCTPRRARWVVAAAVSVIVRICSTIRNSALSSTLRAALLCTDGVAAVHGLRTVSPDRTTASATLPPISRSSASAATG